MYKAVIRQGRSVSIAVPLSRIILEHRTSLVITRHRWSFWLFHDPVFLLLYGKVGSFHSWSVFSKRWQRHRAAVEWQRIERHWWPFLEWCDSKNISVDVFIKPAAVYLTWASPTWHVRRRWTERGHFRSILFGKYSPSVGSIRHRFTSCAASMERELGNVTM